MTIYYDAVPLQTYEWIGEQESDGFSDQVGYLEYLAYFAWTKNCHQYYFIIVKIRDSVIVLTSSILQ